MINYQNPKYSGGIPDATGDRVYSQDYFRDLRYQQQQVGKALEKILGNTNVILEGLAVTQGTGEKINITLGNGVVRFQVTIPDPSATWAVPAATTTDDIFILVEVPAILEFDVSGTYTPGGAINYVKLAYSELDGNTRIRAKKAGSYSYEVQSSYTITVDTTAPSIYEIELTRFTEAGGTFTFDNSNRNENINIESPVNFLSSLPPTSEGTPVLDKDLTRKDYVDTFQNPIIGGITATTNIATTGETRIAALSENRIAFVNDATDDLVAYDLDGANWNQVGNALTVTGISRASITSLGSSRIAMIDDGTQNLSAYDFNGTNWTLVGSSLNIPGIARSVITSLSTTRIALLNEGIASLQTYDFNGTNWNQVGNNFLIAGISRTTITTLSNNRVVLYREITTDPFTTYEFDGTDWTQIGTSSGGARPDTGRGGVTYIDENTIIAIIPEATENTMRIYQFDETSWIQINNQRAISALTNTAITTLNGNQVAAYDSVTDNLETYSILYSRPTYYQENIW
jgi:hypothetical protein